MLAMPLVVTVPAMAHVANTGDVQNSLGIFGYDPAGDNVGTGDGVSGEDVCHEQVVERLVSEVSISKEQAEELLDLVRESAGAEEFEAFSESSAIVAKQPLF